MSTKTALLGDVTVPRSNDAFSQGNAIEYRSFSVITLYSMKLANVETASLTKPWSTRDAYTLMRLGIYEIYPLRIFNSSTITQIYLIFQVY
jgi:hypothetical protein